MRKKIIFFDSEPPTDKTAIHIWLGKSNHPHEQVLQQQIKKYLGNDLFQLQKSPEGKLYLANSPLFFNLSDAGEWIAVVFSWEGPIGIDIECPQEVDDRDLLMKEFFSPSEQTYVGNSTVRFWQVWNRKEAYCKALGIGLQENLKEIECYGDGWTQVGKVWIHTLSLPQNLLGAVAFYDQKHR